MIFSWLAARLAVGGLVALLWVPPSKFGRRFHGMIGFFASLLLAAGLAGGALKGGAGWLLLIASAVWVLLTQWIQTPWIRPTLVPLAAMGVGIIVAGDGFRPRFPVLSSASWVAPASSVAAGLLLGTVTLAMMVGHWYLNVPGLDIRYFRRITALLGACLALRLALGIGGLAASVPTSLAGSSSAWKVAGVEEAFFFWQRVGIGLVAPLVIAGLVERTLRIRSTQSATGLLYVGVVFVLIGEMISRYLYLARGIPQ